MNRSLTRFDTRSPVVPTLSPLQSLPKTHLLTKLTSISPRPVALEPFVLRADVDLDGPSACLWTHDTDVQQLSIWASRWKGLFLLSFSSSLASCVYTGPISILVTTAHPPGSTLAIELAKKIVAFRKTTSTKHKVSAHVLHLAPDTPDNPNAFLNLARVFSRTPTVVLFPGNLSVVPPKTFQRSIGSSAPTVDIKPVVFASRGKTTFPFSDLSPVILKRDDHPWCSERFFPALSRATDWTECLWQLWLDGFGDFETRLTTDWVNELHPAYATNSTEVRVSS